MPFFTLHRDHVLRTTKGHSIGFVKGVKTWVPDLCVPDAVSIGAVPDSEVDVIGDLNKPVAHMSPQEREAKVFVAFESMVARGERYDFTASGVPHAKRLSDLCGFDITNKERDTMWQAFTAKRMAEA